MKKWNRAFALLLAAGLLFLSGCHQHTWIEADCVSPKTCESCGETEGDPLEHSFSWNTVEQAAYFEADTTYMAFTYDEVARHPGVHMFEKAKFKGRVIQIMEDEDTIIMRLAVTKERYGWSDPILVRYSRTDPSEGWILEDDIITAYGMMMGTYTYTSTMGASITIPYMVCVYVDS